MAARPTGGAPDAGMMAAGVPVSVGFGLSGGAGLVHDPATPTQVQQSLGVQTNEKPPVKVNTAVSPGFKKEGSNPQEGKKPQHTGFFGFIY